MVEEKQVETRAFEGLPRHYTEAEVAEYLGVDYRAVKQLLDSGELAFFPVGKRRKITADAIRDYVTRKRKLKPCNQQQTPPSGEGANHALSQKCESVKAQAESISASATETNAEPSVSTRAKVGRPFQSAALVNALLKEK